MSLTRQHWLRQCVLSETILFAFYFSRNIKTNYACRRNLDDNYGRGFNSRRLHRVKRGCRLWSQPSLKARGVWRPNIYMTTKNETSDVSMKCYVYVLYSNKDKGFYIGYTHDLRNRLTQHSKGYVRSTKYRLPLLFIYYEYFVNQKDAKSREVYLKSGFGRRQLKLSLEQTLNSLQLEQN